MAGPILESYLRAPGRASEYFAAIQKGNAPTKFTQDFLEGLGFTSSTDRSLIQVLKGLRFLDESNAPTPHYREYLDTARGKVVLGRQLLAAYEGLFELDRNAHRAKAAELEGKFKSQVNATEATARFMAQTFANLCAIADIEGGRGAPTPAEGADKHAEGEHAAAPRASAGKAGSGQAPMHLNYTIELNLPNTTDIEVFRAIFKAMREHLPL